MMNPRDVYWYVKDILHGLRIESYERVIAKSPLYSWLYATEVLHGRFELGESAIATVDKYAFDYAVNILHKRFVAGEAAINSNAELARLYAEHFGI